MTRASVRRPTAPHLSVLATWRALALEMMPYLSTILLRLDVWDAPGLGTFAVDKRWRLYIDFDHCIANESVQLGAESLLHECGHLVGEHARIADELGVRTPQDAEIWNAAADSAWNDDLEAAGCAELAKIGVTPARIGAPTNQTPQFYYGVLMKKIREQQARAGGRGGRQPQGGAADQPAAGGSPGGTGPQPSSPAPGGTGQDGQRPYQGCGSGSGNLPAPCEFGDDDESGSPITPIEAMTILVETAEQIVKSRGAAPGTMVEAAQALLAPSRTPWQRLLAAHVRAAYLFAAGQVDQSYLRRSRRRDNITLRPLGGGPARKLIRPGWVAPKPIIEVVVDTSGSMVVAEVMACRSEIEAIARRLGCRDDALTVTEVDAAVQSSQKYRSARALGGIHGRGGTDMRVGIAHALNRRPRPDVLLVMSDGYTPWPAERTPVPLVAVLIGRNPPRPPGWVRTVVIDNPTAT
ncbi:vWA domain-containing protein [Microlunatus ginsengisoli]|uniref:vWA domain-containing protein n=1 Tax=Microlunatus ginsengisoli TaxID=363863 RepID=UPI0031D73E7A